MIIQQRVIYAVGIEDNRQTERPVDRRGYDRRQTMQLAGERARWYSTTVQGIIRYTLVTCAAWDNDGVTMVTFDAETFQYRTTTTGDALCTL